MISGAMRGGNTAARLYIEIGADIRSAMANMQAIDRRVNQSADVVRRTNPILQGLGQGLGLAGIASAALATKAVVDLAKGSIDAASDLREAVTLSDQVFEANSASMQAWAEGAADVFGQSQREALNFAAGFGTAFKNVGMDLDTVGDHSRELTRLAADLGSAFNRGSEEAATALRSGLIGETEPMRRFGVFLSEAAVGAKAAQMGIADLGTELTDAQKVAARYEIIMEQTADSQGMFGRDSESLADAQRALAAEFENLAAKAGQMVLPAMVDLTNFINTEGIPALENEIAGVEALAARMGELGSEVKSGTDDLALWIEYAADFMTPWDGSLTMAEIRTRHSMDSIIDSTSDMSTAARAAWAAESAAAAAGASAAVVTAAQIVRSNATVIASYDEMRSRMASAASGAAEAIYGPLIAKGQLAATEREIASQREIIAHGRSTAAAGAASSAQVEAIARQIDAIEALEAASDRAFAKRMGQFSDEIAAQLGILDAEEEARRVAKRDAELAERIAAARADVDAADPSDPIARAAAEARLSDLLEQEEDNRLSDAANARRRELRETQKAIDAIVEHEREATDERKALAEARASAASLASQIAAAREMGDLQKVADLGLVLEAQKAEIAHLALEARHQDRLEDLEREKEILEQRRGAVAASGAAEVADAKLRLAELNQTRIEQLALLASYGDQAAADTLMWSQEIQDALIHGTDEVKARILEIRHELWLLRMDALEAAGALDFSNTFGGVNADPTRGPGFSGHRAAGGPVRRDDLYLVGEEGPEAFVPTSNGSILPNEALAGAGDRHEMHVPEMAASSWSGSDSVGGSATGSNTYFVTVQFQGPVLDPYGDFTQRFAEQLQPALARASARAGG